MNSYIRIELLRSDRSLLCIICSQVLAYAKAEDPANPKTQNHTLISLSPVDFIDEEGLLNTVRNLSLYVIEGKIYRSLCASNFDPVRQEYRLSEFRIDPFLLITPEFVHRTLLEDLFGLGIGK